MKKIIPIIFCLFFTSNLFAQFYVGFNAQYGIKTGGRTLFDLEVFDFSASFNSNTYKEKLSSFGGGFFGGGTLGYKISDKTRVELNVGIHQSNKVKATDSYPDGQFDYVFSANAISFRPSVILDVAKSKNNNLYTKMGLVYTAGSMELNTDGEAQGLRLSRTQTFSNTSGLGMQFGLGLAWELSNKVSLLTELNYIGLQVSPSTSELVKHDENGVSALPGLTISEKQIEYKKEIVLTSVNENQPSQDLRARMPYSGIGLNIGLRFDLGKKSKN